MGGELADCVLQAPGGDVQALGQFAHDLDGDLGELADQLEELMSQTGALESLAGLITSKAELLALAPRSITPGRADNNPRQASVEDVSAIMSAAWDRAAQHADRHLVHG